MIFFKRKKIILDCFTINQIAYEKYPIDYAKSFYPEWLKNSSSSYIQKSETKANVELSTIKRCQGLINYYKNGFIIPIWSDLYFETNENGYKYNFADNESLIESHPQKQWENFANPSQFNNIKIINPWALKTKKDIKFYYGYPFWNYSLHINYFYPPAIIDFKYQTSANINMFIHSNSNFKLSAGDPIVHLIPLSENKIEIKNHLISKEEFIKLKLQNQTNMFALRYLKNKTFQNLKEKKCPFNFKK
jgi:hypothetical protein